MTRLTDALLGGKGPARYSNAPMLDPKYGGQFGWSPDYPAWVSSSPYVRKNLIARVISVPRGFRDLPDSAYWINALKAAFELHPTRIDGLQAQVTLETTSTAFGSAGEQMQTPTNATRQTSEPTLTLPEKVGRPFNYLFENWITELIMDPNTNHPNIITRPGVDLKDHLPDYYTATVLFFEPDPLHKYVDKAWLCTNMFPLNGGPVEGRRDPVAAGEPVELSIPFSCIAQVGVGVKRLAQKLLDEMSLTGANPNLRPAFVDGLSADVRSADAGYAEKLGLTGRTGLSI